MDTIGHLLKRAPCSLFKRAFYRVRNYVVLSPGGVIQHLPLRLAILFDV